MCQREAPDVGVITPTVADVEDAQCKRPFIIVGNALQDGQHREKANYGPYIRKSHKVLVEGRQNVCVSAEWETTELRNLNLIETETTHTLVLSAVHDSLHKFLSHAEMTRAMLTELIDWFIVASREIGRQ